MNGVNFLILRTVGTFLIRYEVQDRDSVVPFGVYGGPWAPRLPCGVVLFGTYLRALAAAKFPVAANPTGILFNPASIAGMIRRLAEGRPYEVGELSCGGGLWFSYDHHGSFARASAKEALEAMNASLTAGVGALAAADYVVLTFGTAWVYRLADSGG